MTKPAKGQAVADPDFGTTIRRVTDGKADWGANVAIPAYPTIQAWSADEAYLIVFVTDPYHGLALLDGQDYHFIEWLDIDPPDVEQWYWSTTEPDILYYVNNVFENDIQHALIRMNVRTHTKQVVHDFKNDMKSGGALADCPANSKVTGGEDPFFMSYDNDLIGLSCDMNKTSGGTELFTAFTYRLSTDKIGSTKDANGKVFTKPGVVPQALPSGNGTYFYDAQGGVKALDAITNATVTSIPSISGEEHSDMLLSANGDDLVASAQFDGTYAAALVVANLTTGTVKKILDDDTRVGTLISGKSWQNRGWIAMATNGCPGGTNANCDTADIVGATSPQTYLDQEILLANVDDGRFCRLAHHRSAGYYNNARNNNYWSQPNVVISPSGTRILFTSDWGSGDPKHPVYDISPDAPSDTYVIELH